MRPLALLVLLRFPFPVRLPAVLLVPLLAGVVPLKTACSDACSSDGDCSAGEFCHARADGTRRCDAPCGDIIECDDGLLCADGRCEDRDPIGEGEGEGEGEVLPTVQNFVASPELVRNGESVTLSWTTAGPVGLCTVTREFDGVAIPDDDGDHNVTDVPFIDTRYSLICEGSSTPELFVSVFVSQITLLLDESEADGVVADTQPVPLRILPTAHTLAPCTVNNVEAEADGTAIVFVDDADGDGIFRIIGACATEGGAEPTTDDLLVIVLFSVTTAPGSVTINTNEDGAACTIDGNPAETNTPVATPSGPTTIACAGQRGDATLTVVVP